MAKLSTAATLLLSVTMVSAQPFNDCDISTYYGTSSPLTTSRSDMHNLLRTTHRDQLAYTSSNYGDTWDALIALDNPNNVDDSTVRLIYGDKLVPSVPYGKYLLMLTSCVHILCSYLMITSHAYLLYTQT